MKLIYLVVLSFIFIFSGLSQEYKSTNYSIKKEKVVSPREMEQGFNPTIYSLEAPVPGGSSTKSYLLDQKIASKEYYKKSKFKPTTPFLKSQQKPVVGDTFVPTRYLSNGSSFPIYGGIPSDNTLAVSNDDIVLVAMNSVLYGYDLKSDTAIFENYYIYLRTIVEGLTTSSYYDPKLIYDPEEDRFVLVLLKDNEPAKSEVIVCFSSTNDPNDPWNIYHLPGNPKDNNRWTDFPAISITNDKLYFTGNLIVPNEPWQTGFDGSIIWEMDKFAGYNGDSSINATLYDSITYNNSYIRNLHTVQGGDGNAETLFLLSNRNFDISNDTIFFLELTNSELFIEPLISDLPYGVPPNARQQDTDTSDANEGLQTNDARVLGAVIIDDEIQFVGNTINPSTGFSAIYHGVVANIYNSPSVTANIIGDSIRDFGYPNIAWSGNEACDREVIIGFNHSSFDDFPGVSSLFCNNDRQYSSVLEVKKGYNYVDRLGGGYERWGDYFGLQRKFNEESTTYAFGYLAMENKKNSGFCAELKSPDTSVIDISFSVDSPQNYCNNSVTAEINSGYPPFTYQWNSESPSSDNKIHGLCAKDTVSCTVTDARGCSTTKKFVVPIKPLENGNIYPNPTSDYAAVQFEIEEDKAVTARLYDANGRLVKELATLPAKSGLNEFSFSLIPLSSGVYTLLLLSDDSEIGSYKVVKQE
ncbi:MAG: T9SS type A sorting domain-containing protein [Brumimicrobium sp.]